MALVKLDSTLDVVQTSQFRNIYYDLIKAEAAKTKKFSELDICCVLLVYHKFVLANGKKAKYMTRRQLGTFFHSFCGIFESNLIDSIIAAIDPVSKTFILPEAFLKFMQMTLRGDLEEKIKFCFSVYDLHGNGKITRERLRRYYRNAIYADTIDEMEESCNDFVDTVLRKLDLDRDGKISFDDYAKSVRKNPCLLQFIGRCIPDLKYVDSIFHTFYNEMIPKI